MIEKVLYDYVKKNSDKPVYLEVPDLTKVKDFFTIEKVGSSKENHINSSIIAIQSWATSLYEAASMNEYIKQIVENSIELNYICSVRLNSDYNFTDTDVKKYRYQALFDIVHY